MFSRGGSNPGPLAHKTNALPTELREIVPDVGLEPTTTGLKGQRSTD